MRRQMRAQSGVAEHAQAHDRADRAQYAEFWFACKYRAAPSEAPARRIHRHHGNHLTFDYSATGQANQEPALPLATGRFVTSR